MTSPIALGVLASGKGSNLANLVDLGYNIVAVGTNRPSSGAAAVARERALPLGEFPQSGYGSALDRDIAMARWLSAQGVEIVVNAGYDRVLSRPFVATFRDRILNIHPSLLPAFGGGTDAVARALDHGVKITGCTVHLVTDDVDAGPILVQAAVPVHDGDTHETLLARIQAEEHRILPEAIELIAEKSASFSK